MCSLGVKLVDSPVIEQLKQGKFNPLYLIYGEEQYLIDRTVQMLREAMVEPEWSDFNYSSHDLLKTTIRTAVEEAESFPFGAGRRLIIAKNAFFLTAAQVKSAVEHDSDTLQQFINEPTDFSTLVLVVPYHKLDERKKIVKELLKKSQVIHLAPLTGDKLESWIASRLKVHKLPTSKEIIQTILRYLPNNLQVMENEIHKLGLYSLTKDFEHWTPTELTQILTKTVEGNVFDLVTYVVNGKFQSAYEIYRELMKQKEEPILIVALLARQFRLMLQTKIMLGQGYSQKQIATQLKSHPFAIKIAAEQSRRFKEDDLSTILERIAELDYFMKTGQQDRYQGLELLLLFIQTKKYQRRK